MDTWTQPHCYRYFCGGCGGGKSDTVQDGEGVDVGYVLDVGDDVSCSIFGSRDAHAHKQYPCPNPSVLSCTDSHSSLRRGNVFWRSHQAMTALCRGGGFVDLDV